MITVVQMVDNILNQCLKISCNEQFGVVNAVVHTAEYILHHDIFTKIGYLIEIFCCYLKGCGTNGLFILYLGSKRSFR